MIRQRRVATRAALLVLGATLVGLFGLAGPAAAHVSVNPREAVQGGYARVAFRVPTESDTLATTKVEVVLPVDAPVASVSTMPVPGWTVTVERRKLETPVDVHGSPVSEVVAKLTWTASGDAGIKPGQFQEFPVSLGPLPAVDSMVFKALQTYSDGTIVRWIEAPVSGGEEPEKPAPVLRLTPAGAVASASPTLVAGAAGGAATDDGTARGLAVAGLIAGLGGLALGGLALARARRRPGLPEAPPADV